MQAAVTDGEDNALSYTANVTPSASYTVSITEGGNTYTVADGAVTAGEAKSETSKDISAERTYTLTAKVKIPAEVKTVLTNDNVNNLYVRFDSKNINNSTEVALPTQTIPMSEFESTTEITITVNNVPALNTNQYNGDLYYKAYLSTSETSNTAPTGYKTGGANQNAVTSGTDTPTTFTLGNLEFSASSK